MTSKHDNFKNKRVTIEVGNELNIKDNLYTPAYHPDTARLNNLGKLSPGKQYKVPSQLNLEEQENVSTNINKHNQKLVDSRKVMMQRRESRQDTLN